MKEESLGQRTGAPKGPRRLFFGSGAQVGSQIAGALLQAANVALLVRLLPKDIFGDFAAAFAVLTILMAVGDFGIRNTTVIELGRRQESVGAILQESLSANALLFALTTIIALPVVLILFPGPAVVALLALLPFAIISQLSNAFSAARQYLLRFGSLAMFMLVSPVVTTVSLALLFALTGHAAPTQRLVWVGGAYLAGGAAAFVVVKRDLALGWLHSHDRFARTLRIIRRAAPIGLVSSISMVHVRVDQILLEATGHGTQLAYYALAYRMTDGVIAICGTLASIAFAIMVRAESSQRAAIGRRATSTLSLLGGGIAFALFMIAPSLVQILGGSSYLRAVWPARLLSLLVFISVANTVPAYVVMVQGAFRKLLWITLLGVALNVALNLLLIPALGAAGSAIATLVTETLGLLLVAVIASRTLVGSMPFMSIARLAVSVVSMTVGALFIWRAGAQFVAVLMCSTMAAVMLFVARDDIRWFASLPRHQRVP